VTSRKPPGIAWESWVEQQIREARERGEFDDLPGHGKPLPDLDRPRDELWWVRKKLQREKVSYSPPAISLRREVDDALEQVAAASTETEVRTLVASINDRIRYVNSHTISGPPTSIGVLDVDDVVQKWRQKRRPGAEAEQTP
jgi:DnaJ homologue, subfamily C, member 28, conserved domain